MLFNLDIILMYLMILSYFSTRGDECMNKTFKVLLGVAAGYGAWSAYKKINPDASHDIKNSISKMSKNATKSIENMM